MTENDVKTNSRTDIIEYCIIEFLSQLESFSMEYFRIPFVKTLSSFKIPFWKNIWIADLKNKLYYNIFSEWLHSFIHCDCCPNANRLLPACLPTCHTPHNRLRPIFEDRRRRQLLWIFYSPQHWVTRVTTPFHCAISCLLYHVHHLTNVSVVKEAKANVSFLLLRTNLPLRETSFLTYTFRNEEESSYILRKLFNGDFNFNSQD